MAAALVALILVVAGVGAVVYMSKQDNDDAAPNATVGSGQPQPSQSGAPPLDPKLADALRSSGYACFESITEPVVVHSCYGDPGTELDEQVVRFHSDPTGKIIGVLVEIKYYEDAAAASSMLGTTVRALTNGFLPVADVETILTSMVKGQKVQKSYTGGSASLYSNAKGLTYVLELVPTDGRLKAIPFGTTKIGPQAINDRFAPRGFQCSVDPKLKAMKCTRREDTAFYQVFAFDPCIDHEAKFESLCAGKGVQSVAVSVGFANGLPRQAYEPIFTFLAQEADWASGGWSEQAKAWVTNNAGDAKFHRADFQQLHIELEPGVGASGGFPSAFRIAVSGLILTPSI